ncbi:MAG: endonuclease MutS2, partial [Thermotogae bacterium]
EMKMEDLIRSLHERLALLEEETKRMEEEKSKYLEMRRKYEEEYTRLKKGKIEEFDKELKDIRDYIKKVKKEIDEAIHLMKKKKLEEMREISKKLEKEKEKLEKIETPTVETEELKVGDNVRIKDGTSIGKVIEVFEKDLLVDFGTMRMRLPRNMVIKVEKKEETFEKLDVIRIERLEKPEVDIRGKTIEESEPLIKNFIDKLVMSDFKKGYIIHGKGTGRLAAGVWEILRKDPRVISYRFGMPSEGGTGVTVVEVRS